MTKRPIVLFTLVLVLGLAIAGCGDDESDGSGNGDTTAAETVTDTDTVTDETVTEDDTVTDDVTETGTVTDDETETAENGGATAPPSRAQQVKNCETSLDAAKGLSADTKERLTDYCRKAASDDPKEVQEAGRDLCERLGSSSGLPDCKEGRP